MELAPERSRRAGAGGLNMRVNKVHHITTIDRIAAQLGESVDFLCDVANEMEPEDGVIWVHGLDDHEVMAFTDFGEENLVELIEIQKRRSRPKSDDATLLWPAADAYSSPEACQRSTRIRRGHDRFTNSSRRYCTNGVVAIGSSTPVSLAEAAKMETY